MDQVALDGAHRLLERLELDWVNSGGGEPAQSPPPAELIEERRRVIRLLRDCLNSSQPSTAAVSTPAQAGHASATPAEAALHKTAYDYLVRLAHRFSGEEVAFADTEEIRAFCERIRRSVEIMVSEFRNLLSGRRQFQEEFSLTTVSSGEGDVGATRIFRRGDIHGDLGKLLFDWRKDRTTEKDEKTLREAIDELKYHQMALLTGFRHSTKDGTLAVMEEVSPGTIHAKAGIVGSIGGGHWRAYRKRFQELIDEDPSWYQRKFMSSFRDGYIDYMWRAKNKQADQ